MRTRIAAIAILVILAACLSGCSSLKQYMSMGQGPTITLQVDPKPGDRWPESASGRALVLEETRQVLMRRIAGMAGVSEPSIAVQGDDRLVVSLPGITDVQKAAKQLTDMGSLEFYYLKNVQSLVNPRAKWKMDVTGADERDYTFTGPKRQILETKKAGDLPKIMALVVGVPKVKPVLTGADLLRNAKSSLQPTTARPIVEIEFSSQGTRKFADFTRSHVNEILGVFYDGRLLTAPKINEPITDGKAIIEGFQSLRDATRVAESINNGALPVHLKVVPAP